MVKAVLIISKSQAYIDYEKNKAIREWNISTIVNPIQNIESANQKDLFGQSYVSFMNLVKSFNNPVTVDKIKGLTKILSKISPEEFEDYSGNGLIIATNVNRNSTRKLESEFKRLGGEIRISDVDTSGAKNKKITSKEQVIALVDTIPLRHDVRKYLIDFAGNDYDTILPLINIISKFDGNVTKRLTINQVKDRMSQQEGGIDPWDFDSFLFKGNIEGTIKAIRRIMSHEGYVRPLFILRNKLKLAYEVSALMKINPKMSHNDIIAVLKNGKNTPNYYTFKMCSELGFDTIDRLNKIMGKLDDKVTIRVVRKEKDFNNKDWFLKTPAFIMNFKKNVNSDEITNYGHISGAIGINDYLGRGDLLIESYLIKMCNVINGKE